MQRIALHTRLAPGREQEYEQVHAVIPEDLDKALREAGVHTWRIWRDGRDLFHVVEVEDYQHMRAFLREHPDVCQSILARIQTELGPEQVASARLLPALAVEPKAPAVEEAEEVAVADGGEHVRDVRERLLAGLLDVGAA